MRPSKLFQICICSLTLTIAMEPRGVAADAADTNLRESPAKATTPFNIKVVEEFRANNGKVGGHFTNSNLLLLHTTGAKTGLPRLTPLVYLKDGDRIIIIASHGGAAKHPAWYHNLVANPKVGVEIGSEQYYATATVAKEPERTKLFDAMAARISAFNAYKEKAAPRVIPVVSLSRNP